MTNGDGLSTAGPAAELAIDSDKQEHHHQSQSSKYNPPEMNQPIIPRGLMSLLQSDDAQQEERYQIVPSSQTPDRSPGSVPRQSISLDSAVDLRRELQAVLSHAHVSLVTIDTSRKILSTKGPFIWVSENNIDGSKQDVKPVTGDAYIGLNIYDAVPSHSSSKGRISEVLRPIEDILNGRITEYTRGHEIGKKWYSTRFESIPGKKQIEAGDPVQGVTIVSLDITELQTRDEELQKRENENKRLLAKEAAAREGSRLKSQFLANMSHEIRTPIAGVIGMAELLVDMDLTDEQRECAEILHRSANGLLTVINDILDFSKVESGRLDVEEVQFSLSLVAQDISKMLGFAAERKDLTFKSDISLGNDRDLIVMGDPGRVRQIITNLLTNSIKFTSEGYVKLSVFIQKERADVVEVKFVVEDTGIGIEEHVLSRLFEPFTQADPSTARRYGGSGLGLTICKNLVELMHGKINLESSLGNGTTATVTIPFNKPQFRGGNTTLVDLESLPDRLQSEMSVSCSSSDLDHLIGTPPLQSPSGFGMFGRRSSKTRSPSTTGSHLASELDLPAADRAKIKVLLVEDNAINQQVALRTIRKLGFIAFAASNGQEALEYLKKADSAGSSLPKPDIILMDVQMPIMDGYRATHIIRRHGPYRLASRHIPIIAMTASAIQGEREKCRKAGMDDYLSKPVMRHTLEKMLVQWAIKKEGFQALSDDESECSASEPGSRCDPSPSPSIPELEMVPEVPSHKARDPKAMSRNPSSRDLNLPGVENEGDREHMREDAEARATALRDDKLFDAAGGSVGIRRNMSERSDNEKLHLEKLTTANVEKLDSDSKGGERSRSWDLSTDENIDGDARTSMAEGGDVSPRSKSSGERGSGSQSPERPSVRRRWKDSEMTVTG
ncbi:hypothetical protein F5884DRAFT_328162 [Xylogone sp. PMI_703]|nr:hypothetical protein F5884DRAFT_328162 [Xylogone sp. PMI_703]